MTVILYVSLRALNDETERMFEVLGDGPEGADDVGEDDV